MHTKKSNQYKDADTDKHNRLKDTGEQLWAKTYRLTDTY